VAAASAAGAAATLKTTGAATALKSAGAATLKSTGRATIESAAGSAAREATESVAGRSTAGESPASAVVTEAAVKVASAAIAVEIPAKAAIAIEVAANESAPVESASAITVPGASADEDAAREPLRPVIAVGSAGVRIIIIVAVRAYRRGANIFRTAVYRDADAYPDGNSLCVCERRTEQNNASQSEKS
jgi:hypothetical protein